MNQSTKAPSFIENKVTEKDQWMWINEECFWNVFYLDVGYNLNRCSFCGKGFRTTHSRRHRINTTHYGTGVDVIRVAMVILRFQGDPRMIICNRDIHNSSTFPLFSSTAQQQFFFFLQQQQRDMKIKKRLQGPQFHQTFITATHTVLSPKSVHLQFAVFQVKSSYLKRLWMKKPGVGMAAVKPLFITALEATLVIFSHMFFLKVKPLKTWPPMQQ